MENKSKTVKSKDKGKLNKSINSESDINKAIVKKVKLAKIGNIYSNLYEKSTGDVINLVKSHNNQMRMSSLVSNDFKSFCNLGNRGSLEIQTTKSSKEQLIEPFIPRRHPRTLLNSVDRTNQIDTDLNNGLNTNSINSKIEFINDSISIQNKGIPTKKNSVAHTRQTSPVNTVPMKFLTQNTNKHNSNQNFFCPFCDHCNKKDYLNVEKYIFNFSQATNAINKGFDYVLQNLNTINKKGMDLLSFNTKMVIEDEGEKIDLKNNLNPESNEDNLEELILNYPQRKFASRLAYQVMANCLTGLLENKFSLDKLAEKSIMLKLKDNFMAKGFAYDFVENEVIYDKELENLLDENAKKIIENLHKKKFLNFDLNDEYLIKRRRDFYLKFKKTDPNLRPDSKFEEIHDYKQKFLVFYIIFIQIISEIYTECKERGALLLKFFKYYFAEQEIKWHSVIYKMKEKIRYYKELCKSVIEQKNSHIKRIEEINEVLFTGKVTKENLDNHKKLIYSLLSIVNEKREEIYLIKSQNEILDKELRFWIYDFDNLKLNMDIRDKMKEININKLMANIQEELCHKSIESDKKSLIINADIFLLLSGERTYFFEAKKNLENEIIRVNDLYKDCYYKNKELKKKYNNLNEEFNMTIKKHTSELILYKNKEMAEKFEAETQTEIDMMSFRKIMRNNDNVILSKRITKSKIASFVENIKYGICKEKPLSMKSLLSFIPEIYNDKMSSDAQLDLEGKLRMNLPDFFYEYMNSKFILKQVVKKHCSETILSVLTYSNEDKRIDYFRRFLGIGDDKLDREILDVFLVLIKFLPISYYKIFEDNSIMIRADNCFNIFENNLTKLKNISRETSVAILKCSKLFINDIEIDHFPENKKFDYLVILRFYHRSTVYFNELLRNLKTQANSTENLNNIFERFTSANKDLSIDFEQFKSIFSRIFKVDNNEVNLEHFIKFFQDKIIELKVRISSFIDISLEYVINFMKGVENKISHQFDFVDKKKQGILYLSDFEKLIKILFNNEESKWRSLEIFNKILNGQDKDFISKDEFILYAKNNSDLLMIFQ